MQNESDFLVKDPKRIFEHLSDLISNNCIITAHVGINKASFLTAILDLDQKRNVLKLDCAPTELLNQQLMSSSKVVFRTELNGIQVSFTGRDMRKAQSDGYPAFAMPIPTAIFWRQRRKFYRVKIPLAHTGSHCRIAFKLGKAENGKIQNATFKLADLSIDGFAFLNPDPEFDGYFQTEKEFTDIGLHLHEANNGRVGFIIKNITDVKVNADTTQQRIGCQFTKIFPAFESSILLYMQDIERQMKNIG